MNDVIRKYNEAADEYARSRMGTEDKEKLEILQSLLRPGDKVLDVGCAAGRDTRILKDMGFNVVGSDLAEKLLDIARKANPDIQFILADMRKLPFGDQSFHGVWACAVLHHVPKKDMPGVLQEFWRVLAPGGILYVHTKAGEGTLRTNEETVKGAAREFVLLTADELDGMLQKANYRKVQLEVRASKSRPGLFWLSGFYKKLV